MIYCDNCKLYKPEGENTLEKCYKNYKIVHRYDKQLIKYDDPSKKNKNNNCNDFEIKISWWSRWF